MTAEPPRAGRPLSGFDATFGPVDVVTETAWAEPDFDVVVTSAASFGAVAELCAAGPPDPLGTVATVVAVPGPRPLASAEQPCADAEPPTPVLVSAASLRTLLLEAPAVYCADLTRSTSGRLLAAVLRSLGIGPAVIPRLHIYGSGTDSMPALAAAEPGAVGVAQLSEVVATGGVLALRRADDTPALPEPFARSTTYVAALGSRSRSPEAARHWIASLIGPATATLRMACGFKPAE